ncbi:hypothetical protein L596_005981 [Steinernema carpocapsae]|uniref:TLC domain-containing protein n=1 Tax=Steinernema carpocapsae TaxID=34508 RepID=A0A4U8V269_STECR|nr:hypothetical protein L596_005981 [Steinernema carpocapsae]
MGLWNPAVWLPRDVPWSHVPSKFEDLWYPIYFAVPLIVVRLLWEACVGIPLAAAFGYIKGPILPQVTEYLFFGFSKNTKRKRVLECFFRTSIYVVFFVFGCFTLYDKSWMWDVTECWKNYPNHEIDNTVWWYYMLETGFYCSLLISSTFETRRSDFWQLIFHHVVTIGLLSASWTINFVRVGTLVLISHDLSDIIMELGKLVRYGKIGPLATNFMFVMFLTSWIVTRLGFYPFVVIRSAVMDAPTLIQPGWQLLDFTQIPHAPRVIIIMLICLFALHVFWTFIILKIIIRTVTKGEARDVRSSESEADDDDKSRLVNKRKKSPQRIREERKKRE